MKMVKNGKVVINMYAVMTGGIDSCGSLMMMTETEVMETMHSDIEEGTYDGEANIVDYLNNLIQPIDGGFSGDWVQDRIEIDIKVVNHHIND